jgi:glycosyltransferase involved in cell wall biosynthesis
MADISVIVASYNRGPLVCQALDSILAQTLPPAEVLIVDDGSQPATRAQLQAYVSAHPRANLRLISQANAGPSAARNHGLAEARGRYLAFLDDDDLWLPTKLEKQLTLLERHADAVGVYCRSFKFRRDYDDLRRAQPQNRIDDPDLAHVITTMCIQISTVLIRRDAAGDVRFDPAWRDGEDALYAAELRLRGRWRLVDEALAAYRAHGDQATADPGHAFRHTRARVAWLRAHTARLPAGQAQLLEDRLWSGLIQGLEHRYWQRQFDGLEELRAQLRQACPQLLERSFMARRRLYPRWVYRLRDCLPGRGAAVRPVTSNRSEP